MSAAIRLRSVFARRTRAQGLITIERERVFQYRWFKTTTTSTVQRIQVPADFEGNGYVTVQFLRDPASDELFLSPLSYGVAAFSTNLDARTETVTLNAPREVKPGTAMMIRVTAFRTVQGRCSGSR
jgi:uncharacterized protein YfaS (alpha-2-macroglobulin family)